MSRSWMVAAACVASALGCSGADGPPPSGGGAEGTNEVEAPPPDDTADPGDTHGLVGAWRAEVGGGGPVAGHLEYELRADGTYEMTGYPSIGERGRYRVESRDGDAIVLRLTERRACGPCSAEGPVEPRPDESFDATLDGDALTFRGQTYARMQR